MLNRSTCGTLPSLRTFTARLRYSQLILIALASLLVIAGSAGGQGTDDALPKPITTGEIVRYMELLNLSDQQQLAVTSMHDDYRRSYRALYDNEIEQFLEEMRSMTGFSVPSRDELEDISRGVRTLEGRVRSLDARLFDQMQAILTDEQLAIMPRVRLARQRHTYNQQQHLQMWTMGTPLVDLSAIMHELELPEADHAAIDPLVARYESNVTSRLGSLHDSATSLWMDLYDAIEAAGFNLDEMQDFENADPEEMQKMMQAMQQIFMELTAKGRKEVNRIRALNRDTLQSFRGLIPDESYRRIRNAYYSRAYPHIAAMTQSMPVGTTLLAELNDITEQQRQAAADAVRTALIELDAVVQDAIDKIDHFRSTFNFMDFDQEAFQRHNEQLNELQQKAGEIAQQLQRRLTEILTAEQVQQYLAHSAELARKAAGNTDAMLITEPRSEVQADESAEQDYVYVSNSPDSLLPDGINSRDLTTYHELLDSTEDQQTIIAELHADYIEAIETLEAGPIQQVVEAQSKLWRWNQDDESPQDMRPAEQRVDEILSLRRQAMQAIEAADREFFDQISMLLSDESRIERLQRVRQLRARQRCNVLGAQMIGYGGNTTSREAQIDVVEFLLRQNADRQLLTAVELVLIEYGAVVHPLAQRRYESALQSQRAQDLWSLRWQELQRDEGTAAAQTKLMREYQDTIGKASTELAEIQSQLAAINADTIDRVLASLPDETARRILRAYRRAAFPDVFRDAGSVEKYLDNALALDSISPDQRNSLIDLQAEYIPSYDELCMTMLNLSRRAPASRFTGDSEGWRKYQEFNDRMQKLNFERRELNSRALLRLRQILTAEQMEAMGGLPEVVETTNDQPVYW